MMVTLVQMEQTLFLELLLPLVVVVVQEEVTLLCLEVLVVGVGLEVQEMGHTDKDLMVLLEISVVEVVELVELD